jgi:UDP:flavonoid glycosyltransferase YjiC (YdhE family)
MTEARRVLLCCHDAGGTVPPMLAIATELVARGHDVVWISQPSVERRASAAGCRFMRFDGLGDYDATRSIEEQPELAMALMTGTAVGDQVIDVCGTERIDAVVIDCNLASVAAATESLGLPSAVILHSMYRTYVDVWLGEWWPVFAPSIDAARARYGLRPADGWTDVFAGHDRLISAVPESFEAPVDAVPATLRRFGFLVPGTAEPPIVPHRLAAGGEPTVLVGLSTTYMGQETVLERIIDALGSLPVRGIVTTSGHLAAGTASPSNVELHEHLDHGPVLETASAMITHAGLGTVAAGLSRGVPLVCTPLARDQPLNADRVAHLGAGVVLDSEASTEEIGRALMRVISDDGYRRAAAAVASESRAAGGARAAVDDLEEQVSSAQRP